MKANVFDQYGGPEVLRYTDAPDPEVGPGDVLVRVRACAINHLDLWVRQGLPRTPGVMPHILGADAAGDVAAVGAEVRGFAVGDRVFIAPGMGCGVCDACRSGSDNACAEYTILGFQPQGGYAELCAVPERRVHPIPTGLDFGEAAAFPLTFVTAWHMLVTRAKVRPGERVLVQAAASGVGVAAVQIAKLAGAWVIASAGSDAKLERASGLGADVAVNYETEPLDERVRALTGGEGVDIVIDHTGAALWPRALRCLARRGRLVTCGATSGVEAATNLALLFLSNHTIMGTFMGTQADLASVSRLVGERRLRTVIDREFPLAEADEAHRYVADRRQFGKVLLRP